MERGRRVSFDCNLSGGGLFVDGDVLETLLDDLEDLLALAGLKAVFAVLTDLTLELVLLFCCAFFRGFLAACLQFDDFYVLGEDWDFYVLGRWGFLAGVISYEVQLLAILMVLTVSVGASCLFSQDFLSMSDQHFFLKIITVFDLFQFMERCRCLLLISFVSRPQMLLNRLILLDNLHLIPYLFLASYPLSLKGLLLFLTLIDDIRIDGFYLIASISYQRREILDKIGSIATVNDLNLAEIQLRQFHTFVIFIQSAEALPLQVRILHIPEVMQTGDRLRDILDIIIRPFYSQPFEVRIFDGNKPFNQQSLSEEGTHISYIFTNYLDLVLHMPIAHLNRVLVLFGEQQELLEELEGFAHMPSNDGSQCFVNEEGGGLEAGGLVVLLVDGLAWGLIYVVGLDDDGTLAVHLTSVHDKIIKGWMGQQYMGRYNTELEGEEDCGWDFDRVGGIFGVRIGYDVLLMKIMKGFDIKLTIMDNRNIEIDDHLVMTTPLALSQCQIKVLTQQGSMILQFMCCWVILCLLSPESRLSILLFQTLSKAICSQICMHCASTSTLLPLPTTFILSLLDCSQIPPFLPSEDFCVGNTFEESVYFPAKMSVILNLLSSCTL